MKPLAPALRPLLSCVGLLAALRWTEAASTAPRHAVRTGPGAAAGSPKKQEDRLSAALEELAREALRAGAQRLVLAVDVGGERTFSRGWGGDSPPDGDTFVHAGPLLSSFLAVAALQLAEHEALDLEAALSAYLPELPYGALGVRLDQLLTHTSGIPGSAELLRSGGEHTRARERERILARLHDGPLESSPGSCASYSDSNDLLLGLVLEGVAKKELKELLAGALFAAAGMDDTGWDCAAPGRGTAPIEHEFAGGLEDQGDASPPFDAQEFCSTAHDLLRFQRALVGERLLGRSSLDLRAAPPALADGSGSASARGISLTPLNALPRHSSGGGMAGERLQLSYFPTLDATLVVWAGGEDVPVLQLAAQAARILFELEAPGIHDLATSPEQRARHIGDYYAGCSSYGIADEEEHLVLYPPDGPRSVLLFQGGETYLARGDPDLRVTFEAEGERVVAFVLSEHGASLRARRMY